MALRTPTDWDFTYDETALAPGQQIRFTVPDIVVDNQQYCYQRDRLLLSAVWSPYEVDAAVWTTVWDDGGCVGPNMLGTAATAAIDSVIYAWCDDAVSTWEVRLYHATHGTHTHTITGAGSDTKQWRGSPAGSFTPPATGAIWDFDLDARRTAGSGKLYVAGLGLFY